jgi:magnesium-transporting ATPase (P-type)
MSALVMNSKRSTSGRVYTKGASEVLLAKCASYLNLQGKEVPLTAAVRKDVAKTIQLMASNALRTVALVHRDVSRVTGRENAFEIESGDFILDMIVGIKDPLRPEVVDAVRTCQAAGIMVRMVTGDNIDTAKAIARECGILTEGGIAMEGPEFRKLTPAQVDAVLPTLQVLARSSPTDKHTLVTRLNGRNLPSTKEEWEEAHPDESWAKSRDRLLPGYAEEWHRSRQYGEVVGVTGDGTNDGPALKAADVGLSMGLSGTDGKLLCMYVRMNECCCCVYLKHTVEASNPCLAYHAFQEPSL